MPYHLRFKLHSAGDELEINAVLGDRVIHITYGNRANGILKDKTLSLRPAVIDDAPVVPVARVGRE